MLLLDLSSPRLHSSWGILNWIFNFVSALCPKGAGLPNRGIGLEPERFLKRGCHWSRRGVLREGGKGAFFKEGSNSQVVTHFSLSPYLLYPESWDLLTALPETQSLILRILLPHCGYPSFLICIQMGISYIPANWYLAPLSYLCISFPATAQKKGLFPKKIVGRCLFLFFLCSFFSPRSVNGTNPFISLR